MTKIAVIAFLAATASQPAIGVVVYQKTGISDFTIFEYATLPGAGNYKVTFDAPNYLPAPSEFAILLSGVTESTFYFNNIVQFKNDAPMSFDLALSRIGTAFIGEMNVPEEVDERDSTGTGYVYDYFWSSGSMGFLVDAIIQPAQPVSWTYTVETIAAVPEPATWGSMIAGFVLAGASLRHRQVCWRGEPSV